MQIILVHPGFAKAKSLTLKPRHLALLLVVLLLLIGSSTAGLFYLASRYGSYLPIPMINTVQAAASAQGQADLQDRYLRENVAAMAVKLGELQAQMMRLDALGERVQGLAGIKPETFNFREKPGRGGLDASLSGRELDMVELRKALDAMSADMQSRSDYLNVVESALMSDKIQFKQLPTVQPVNASYNASGFGWRIDPFNGRQAFHGGIDFPGPVGTPVVAAAGGVVVAAEYHPQYGNLLEIDHGNEILTRYAHNSRLHVKLGDIVRKGQRVADLGSTGRSTGAHLHFEVLVKSIQQDPHKFLSAGAAAQAKLLAAANK